MYKYRFAVFLHKITRLTKRICDVTQTVKNLVNRKRDCVFIYRQKERRSFHKTKELYEIFLNYTSSYKSIRIDMTHTASIMPLPISYFIPMNSPYHTSMNSKKRGRKRFDGRWRRKIFITGCIYALFFLTQHSFFFLLRLIIWTNRQAKKAGRQAWFSLSI